MLDAAAPLGRLCGTPMEAYSTGRDTVVYENIYPGTDLAYISTDWGIKETLVLKKPTTQNEYSFYLAAQGLTLAQSAGGEYAFTGANGETVFALGGYLQKYCLAFRYK